MNNIDLCPNDEDMSREHAIKKLVIYHRSSIVNKYICTKCQRYLEEVKHEDGRVEYTYHE